MYTKKINLSRKKGAGGILRGIFQGIMCLNHPLQEGQMPFTIYSASSI